MSDELHDKLGDDMRWDKQEPDCPAPVAPEGVSVYGGKYTVQCDGDGQMRCLRYGEPWRDLTGDGMVLALVQEIQNARATEALQRDLIRELEAAASLHWITEEELKLARTDLARVTAERDRYRDRLEIDPGGSDKIEELESAAEHLRARVAELESESGNWGRLKEEIERAKKAEQRVAELVAALQSIAAGDGDERRRAEDALTCAESATPAKHPDTDELAELRRDKEIIDYIETLANAKMWEERKYRWSMMHNTDYPIRAESFRAVVCASLALFRARNAEQALIDAAMKGGAHD